MQIFFWTNICYFLGEQYIFYTVMIGLLKMVLGNYIIELGVDAMKMLIKVLFITLLFFLAGCDGNSDGSKNDDANQPIIDENSTFTITFKTDGGTSIPDQNVIEGKTIFFPDNPNKEGFIFIQWHTNENLNSPFDQASLITQDITLYAEWREIEKDDVVITFVTEHGNMVPPIIAKAGEVIHAPSEPNSVFFDFIEWNVMGTNNVFDFTTMPESNLTLEAVWLKNDTYEITFYINETTKYHTMLFTSGTTISLPSDPEIDDHVFLGWYVDTSYVTEFDVNDPLPSNFIDVYGQSVLIEDYVFRVSFETNGGNVIDSQIKMIGKTVVEPNDPIKNGYIFDGWFRDETFEDAYDFNQIQNEDLTLYAKWTFDESHTITNLIVSDEEVINIILDQGENMDLPQLFKDGFIFDGWYTSQNYQVRYRDYLYFAQPLGYELNLYAKWVEAPNVVYITIDTNGGTEARFTKGAGVIETGTIQANPSDQYTIYNPSREGYDFVGWYTDEELTNLLFATSYGNSNQTINIPSEDTTLYAKWVSKTTGEVDDGSTISDVSLIEKLEEFGFVCSDLNCILEEYQNYNYTYDLQTNMLSYVIDVEQVSDDGYRYYDRVLTIDPNYDIYYSYQVEEDYGFLYMIEITIEGNYITNTYEVTHFNSNVTQEQTNYDKAMEFIENIVYLYEAILR